LTEGLGIASESTHPHLFVDDLTNAEKSPIEVYDGELSEAPRLVLQDVKPWDALSRQLSGQAHLVNFLHILDAQIGARKRLGGFEFGMAEEVKFNGASTKYGVGAVVLVRAALKSEASVEGDSLGD